MKKIKRHTGKFDLIVKKTIENSLEEILPEVIYRVTRQKWLTSSEASMLLQCSKRHLQYLRDSGQLKFYKAGRKIRFHIEDVESYIKGGGKA